jgi:hypothetical protein
MGWSKINAGSRLAVDAVGRELEHLKRSNDRHEELRFKKAELKVE